MDLLQKSFRSRSEGGHIQLILGPMFSGKSTELMRRIKRYQIASKRCLTIKYAKVFFLLTFFTTFLEKKIQKNFFFIKYFFPKIKNTNINFLTVRFSPGMFGLQYTIRYYIPARIKGRATNFGRGQDGRQFFWCFLGRAIIFQEKNTGRATQKIGGRVTPNHRPSFYTGGV